MLRAAGRHRLHRISGRVLVGVLVLAAAVGLVLALQATRHQASTAEQTAQTVTVQRDATAAQAVSLADQVAAACKAGGDTAMQLEQVGACRQAQQVQSTPIAGPAGPVGATGATGAVGAVAVTSEGSRTITARTAGPKSSRR